MLKIQYFGRCLVFFLLIFALPLSSQTLKGKVIESVNQEPVPGVEVAITGTAFREITDAEGFFSFAGSIPRGDYIISFSRSTYLTKRYPVNISEGAKDLGIVFLEPDFLELQLSAAVVELDENDFEDEDAAFANVSGLLQASKDVFLNAAAFDFSQTFFRPRGFDSEYSKILINGIEMNKFFNGRPLWSDWGGLNDVQRNQVFSLGMTPSDHSFGGLAGTTNIIMRASQFKEGGKFSYAIANRAYTGRFMGSYHSGLSESGWAYSVAVSRRFSEGSYMEGSIYEANSFFASVEKKIDDHSINFTGIYSPIRRGKNAPVTQEVYELKGNKYNPYWGFQEGEIRNSRINTVKEPILMLNHLWKISDKTELNNNIAYQFGHRGDSRIDYSGSRIISGRNGEQAFVGGGSNPDPVYYQKMPSYFLRFSDNPDYHAAYLAQKDLQKDGQINWPQIYTANQTSTAAGGNSLYVLYEDRINDKQLSFNSILRHEVNQHLVLNAAVDYRDLKSSNHAQVVDMLGGSGYLDVDSFSEGDKAQNDLLSPNRIVSEGEKFKYNYELTANAAEVFLQAQFFYKFVDFYVAAQGSYREYQRIGLFKNGNFPGNSLGESSLVEFTGFGGKSGLTYKMSGRNLFDINVSYQERPPAMRNTFSNVRQNHNIVEDIQQEKIAAGDISYILRGRRMRGRLTGFVGDFRNGTEVSFYYADGISGMGRDSTTAFVQEIMTGVNRRNIGIESGLEVSLTSTLKLKSAASLGEYVYSANPQLYLASDDFKQNLKIGEAYLKNYRVSGGPQTAAQAGFEYRDPDYWWFSATANYFSRAYVDVAPLLRTKNFALDSDGLPLVTYDEQRAKELLKQEKLSDYYLVNLVGGKSWRLKSHFIGFFGSVNNILDKQYKTGGFEQSRSANFQLLDTDRQRDQPLFASKYWFGPGTSYYTHVYYRF